MPKILRFYDNIKFETREALNDAGKTVYTIYGQPIVFNSKTDIGYFEETIESAALSDVNSLRDVLLFINHNDRMIPLARSRNNTSVSTMRLSVNEFGLNFEADLDVENNTDAKSLYSAIQRQDITGMSFAFTVTTERWENLDTDKPLRVIEKFDRIYEVSAVNFPAYEATSINNRSDKDALDSAKLTLDNVRSLTNNDELELLKLKAKLYI